MNGREFDEARTDSPEPVLAGPNLQPRSLQIQLQIPVLDPADLPKKISQDGCQDGGNQETYEEDAEPHPGSAAHGGEYADGAYQAAGSHAGACRDIFQAEDHGSQGAGDHGNYRGRYPDAGVMHDISHLEHAGSQPLGQEAAHLIFLPAHEGEADHLSAAARCGGTSCQSVQGQGNADGRAADGEGEGDADKGGDQHAHEEGLHLRGSFYEVPKPGHEARYAGADELGSEHTGDDGGSRSDEDVQTRFFGDDFAQLRRDDGGNQGAYGAAQVISRKAYGGGREKDELRGL